MTGGERLSLSVTPETCAGTGVCTFYAAGTFELDDDGRVSIVDEHGDPDDDIRNAVEACPTRSLRLGPSGGGRP
ncbi:ferredoxin [Prauserella sp. PE36]|uniref:Ferredoxin n=1 Tax=Prauserella endophytica TaxID=1592324 RepID=A0ABY2S4V3_9PSEU|nr:MULTISPECIES: ferredoxin [Prauserella]PXY33247.1 hypothetical protein BAY59_09075 [Prauserella coralliicola]RBM16200.1 ferredoxin [Prauserella sp. PE36]TKG70827.1 ferredoxin [Prauserella endophytica]